MESTSRGGVALVRSPAVPTGRSRLKYPVTPLVQLIDSQYRSVLSVKITPTSVSLQLGVRAAFEAAVAWVLHGTPFDRVVTQLDSNRVDRRMISTATTVIHIPIPDEVSVIASAERMRFLYRAIIVTAEVILNGQVEDQIPLNRRLRP